MEYLISGISLPPDTYGSTRLPQLVASRLGLPEELSSGINIVKRSIDARRRSEVKVIYQISLTLPGDRSISSLRLSRSCSVRPYEPVRYSYESITPSAAPCDGERPIVIGAGPAGLFAALLLAEAGLRPIVLERGKPADERKHDVERLWDEGIHTTDSDTAFGEGGAGTFSDGKLYTGNHDRYGRIAYILRSLVRFGAEPSILYDQRPHIGTDCLVAILPRIREHITGLGGEYRFGAKVTGLRTSSGRLTGVVLSDGSVTECREAILAIGHSARDTYEYLYNMGLTMEVKAFAAGFRVEHPQEMIDKAQYSDAAKYLPAASYKLTAHCNNRSIFSFCMCPGGYVVDSSTEDGGIVVNGMSYMKRDGANANSAIVVSVDPSDYGSDNPLSAIDYQRHLESAAYTLGDGAIPQQLYGDFLSGNRSVSYGSYPSACRGRTMLCDMSGLFPEGINQAFIAAMGEFDRHIKGFGAYDTILSGVESRTSAPVRIIRDEGCESSIKGLYPCGEGAGYAGGITSAASDGLIVAEKIIERRA